MATVVAVMAAATHAPGLTGWFDRAPESDREVVRAGYGELRRRLEVARPDVLLMLSDETRLSGLTNPSKSATGAIGTFGQRAVH